MDSPTIRAGGTVDEDVVAAAEAISSRAARKATAVAIIMDAAAEAVANTAKVAVGAEPSRALTYAMK